MEDSPVAFSPLRLWWVRNSGHRDRWQAEHDTYGFETPQATVGQSAERDQKISAWCLLHQKKPHRIWRCPCWSMYNKFIFEQRISWRSHSRYLKLFREWVGDRGGSCFMKRTRVNKIFTLSLYVRTKYKAIKCSWIPESVSSAGGWAWKSPLDDHLHVDLDDLLDDQDDGTAVDRVLGAELAHAGEGLSLLLHLQGFCHRLLQEGFPFQLLKNNWCWVWCMSVTDPPRVYKQLLTAFQLLWKQ